MTDKTKFALVLAGLAMVLMMFNWLSINIIAQDEYTVPITDSNNGKCVEYTYHVPMRYTKDGTDMDTAIKEHNIKPDYQTDCLVGVAH